MIHQNLCDHAEDRAALYRLWDNDLRKMTRRRQFYELAGSLCLLAFPGVWKSGVESYWLAFVAVIGIYSMFSTVKLMIDESNTNYLMHQWDLQNALEYFRRTDTSGRA
jgi:hypothetical protein